MGAKSNTQESQRGLHYTTAEESKQQEARRHEAYHAPQLNVEAPGQTINRETHGRNKD